MQMNESQKAFEARFPCLNLEKVSLVFYTNSITLKRFSSWVAGEAYGRKQALEELKAAFLNFENNKVAQLAIVKELIK
jgi:hypothetical protein